jgi:hypothetical protein
MKKSLAKILLALSCTLSLAAVSSEALAHRHHHHYGYRHIYATCASSCCGHCSVYAYRGCGYHRFIRPHAGTFGEVEGRPVKYVDGGYYYVQKCSSAGYWHHRWHRAFCS